MSCFSFDSIRIPKSSWFFRGVSVSMIQNSGRSLRRILMLPAVPPCECVFPVTLIHDLISLSRNICDFQPKIVATHKRDAREAIRQVGLLLIFFEEVQDRYRRSALPDLVVLCFSELHITLQKLRYILEDCTREGVRLWILMNCKRVSTEFRVLIRTVATVLDVLPLDSIDVSTEVRELVELVAKQAQKAKFDVDPDDERTAKNVLSILNQFDDGVWPSPYDVRRILDHLEVRSWNECSNEAKFLDEEISLEAYNGDEREIVPLSSLMGFMIYCRIVMFEAVDGKGSEWFDNRDEGEVLSYLNPEDFRCPISLEIMSNPVTLSTGHTYDRSSIQKWLKAGNLTCPKTGEKLTNTELVPNLALKKLIQQFCSDSRTPVTETGGRSRDITRTIFAGSPAAEEAMKMLAKFLADRLAKGTGEERKKAAYEIRLLAKSSIFNRSCLADAGTIPNLLKLLSTTDPSIQENAMAALLNLSKHSKSKMLIVKNNGLGLILDVLRRGIAIDSRQMAAATLFYLASVEEYRKLIGEMPNAISSLVELMRIGTVRGKKNAVVAIFGLLLCPDNHQRVLEAGAVPLLVHMLISSERFDLVIDSLAVLAKLGEKPDGTIAILCTSALPLLVGILRSSTSRAAQEYCVSLLLPLCINGGAEVAAILQKTPSLMESLYTLITEGTSRASKKASALLSVLHEFHGPSSSSLLAQAVQQEQIALLAQAAHPPL
ncbi:PREDICTED: U-box domain-containing protein 19-like [Nelumbo nucifera]|uniref:RING-type E3 ubiquitin transferase n=2 Tax=Nelumbo nucifera TaxID=4432 RepID=A0A822YJ79_NELNU|nr:PREDICTED: U-box domain-containing protein 19-like [Nelumbo nucifera]DAD30976.1 TPA_asm: hypothetical protein HUJ06_009827 [Nelumbo nucifera]